MGDGGCDAITATAQPQVRDPENRLYQEAGVTRFVYDGEQIIAEYNTSGAITRRHVPGIGLDDIATSYDASGVRSWPLTDERGSVIALSDTGGTATWINRYDEYGVPQNNDGRFQYTGQPWLPGAGVYHYRARQYAPQLGRFLQTDPMGYAAGMNLYAYVGADPINATDPLEVPSERARALPTMARAMRPLPSSNGGMVTNHRCAGADLMTGSTDSSPLNPSMKSDIRPGSRSAAVVR